MADESDGIDEALDGHMRVLITAAARMGETLARAREEASRRAQADSERAARELTSRFEAERAAAHTEMASVHRGDWWERATPEQIAGAYQTAHSWAQDDPEAARAEERMREELSTRYGIDVDNTHADPNAVREAIERAAQSPEQSAAEKQRAAAEQAEAARLLTEADRADHDADRSRAAGDSEAEHHERQDQQSEAEMRQAQADAARAAAQPLYDSAERREATAADLETKGVSPEAVSARMRSDVSQAQPATQAAASVRDKSPKARKGRSARPRAAEHTR